MVLFTTKVLFTFFFTNEVNLTNHDTNENSKKHKWAKLNAISYIEALKKLEINGEALGLDNDTIKEGKKLELRSAVKMGGSGHIHLLYDCVRILKVKNVIETGVAYGWLVWLFLKRYLKIIGKLYSVDMPYQGKK